VPAAAPNPIRCLPEMVWPPRPADEGANKNPLADAGLGACLRVPTHANKEHDHRKAQLSMPHDL